MILFPPCKINIGLHVKHKRPDGYHELESVMYQVPWCDILEIVPSEKFSFDSSGLKIDGNSDSNLCVKAYHLLKNDFTLPPVSIYLHKILPMGAGLGGGSADGAYTLLLLNDLFKLNLSDENLRVYAAQLGSDCALFISKEPQLAKGRGEVLTNQPLDLKGYYLHLINLGIHISTKQAFANLTFKANSVILEDLLKNDIITWKDNVKNDFEDSVFPIYPELKILKEKLYKNGAIYASMTGSGSTMYAIYNEEPKLLAINNSIGYIEKVVLL